MAPDAPGPDARPATPSQLAWLERETVAWAEAGVIDARQAETIRGRYVAVRRFSLTRLLLALGAAFVGVGLIWLVASNLDAMAPLPRFGTVVVVWLLFVGAAEGLARRAGGGAGLPAAFQLMAALAFGAVVFQAAQSLQVPAYEASLVGVWGLGALVYAYAVDGVPPLLVGVAAGTGWFVWEVVEDSQDGMGFVVPVLVAAVAAAAVAALHAGRWRPAFAATWRESAALLALLGLFVAAFPYVDREEFTWTFTVVAGAAVALLLAAAAVLLTETRIRLEPLAPVAALVVGVLLVLWEQPEPVDGAVSGEGYAHALVSVAAYVVAAGWYAALGVLRDSTRLTLVATAALVLFTTVQSFAVFAPIISGASLFLVLGFVFLVTGLLVDRGRRRLVAGLREGS